VNQTKRYVDLKGLSHALVDLDTEERQLLRELIERASRQPDWNDFSNHWMKRVGDFYAGRGFSRQQTRQTVVYRIAQDLASRIAVQAGIARAPDFKTS
jgi:hypothetical protein